MSTLNNKHTDIISFLHTVCEDNIPQLVAINSKGGNPKVIKPDNIEEINNKSYNIYFSVNEVKKGLSKKATKDDITKVRYAHLDLDPVEDDKYSHELRESLLKLAETIDCTFAIDSGNGVGLFWRVKGDISHNQIEDINLALIEKYKGYGADKGTHNVDRIMRLPFTMNYPTATKLKKGYSPEPVPSSLIQSNDKTFKLNEILKDKINLDSIEIIDSDDMSEVDFAFFKDYISLKQESEPNTTVSVDEIRKALRDKDMYEVRKERSPDNPDKYNRDKYIEGTIKRATRSLNEVVEDFKAIGDKPTTRNPLSKLLSGAMTKERRLELKNMNFLIDGFLPEGHHTIIYGASGSGKTTVFHNVAKEICRNTGKTVMFLYLDGSPDIALKMDEDIENNGLSESYKIIYDFGASDIVDMLKDMIKFKEDLSDYVFILDTFKYITKDINNKNANKEALHLIKNLQKLGASFISLAHTNKDGKKNSGTAEIEQDSDNLLRIDSELLDDGETVLTSITRGGRVRMKFTPRTYRFKAGEPNSAQLEQDFEPLDDESKVQREKEDKEAETVEKVLKFLGEDRKPKKDIIDFVSALGYSVRQAKTIVENGINKDWVQEGKRGKPVYLVSKSVVVAEEF